LIEFIELLGLLIFAHTLADYPLQGDFLAKGKNRTAPIPGIPWQHPLAAHSIIHGGFVGVITGSLWLGLAETVIHAVTDDAKCQGRISYNVDQAIHVACKIIWAVVVVF
jgi:type IV secretory pathway VirB3-like protein